MTEVFTEMVKRGWQLPSSAASPYKGSAASAALVSNTQTLAGADTVQRLVSPLQSQICEQALAGAALRQPLATRDCEEQALEPPAPQRLRDGNSCD